MLFTPSSIINDKTEEIHKTVWLSGFLRCTSSFQMVYIPAPVNFSSNNFSYFLWADNHIDLIQDFNTLITKF